MDKEAKLRFREMVGANIRMARQRAGLSLEELGEPLNLSRGSISIIERGGQAVSLEQLMVIAATLGCTADELVPGIGQIVPRGALINPELAQVLIKLGAKRQHSLLRLLLEGVIRPPDDCPRSPNAVSNGE